MVKLTPHTLLFIIMMLIQIFILNQLSFSNLCMPLIYPVVIILYPVQSDQLRMLLVGLAVGVCSDLLMGVVGINTIALLFVSYIRVWLLELTMDREIFTTGGEITAVRLGRRRYFAYTTIFILLFNVIYFSLESLDSVTWMVLAERIAVSTLATLPFVWFVTPIFASLAWRER